MCCVTTLIVNLKHIGHCYIVIGIAVLSIALLELVLTNCKLSCLIISNTYINPRALSLCISYVAGAKTSDSIEQRPTWTGCWLHERAADINGVIMDPATCLMADISVTDNSVTNSST